MSIRHVLAAALCLGLASPLPAQGLEGLVSLEVIDGGAAPDGTQRAALKLTLAPGWKTYWRAPGETGVPPAFDWRGSRNMAGLEISWPAPEVFYSNGLRTIGYDGQLVLPLLIRPRQHGAPVDLEGAIEFGICREVCIPGLLDFDARLMPDTPPSAAIAAALAERPFSASEAGVRSAACRVAPAPGGLRITAEIDLPPTGGDEIAVIESGHPLVWSTDARVARSGERLTATADLYHAEGGVFALDRGAVRITVLGAARAVDIRGCAAG